MSTLLENFFNNLPGSPIPPTPVKKGSLFSPPFFKSWEWHQTKMTDPTRAEGHWLAIAIAISWRSCVSEVTAPSPINKDRLPSNHIAPQRSGTGTLENPTRKFRCYRRGCLLILAALSCYAFKRR